MANKNSETKTGVEQVEIRYQRHMAMEVRGQIGTMVYYLHLRGQELLEAIESLDDQRAKDKLIAELRSVSCAFIK